MLRANADDVEYSRLPDTLSYADGALLEPLAVAIHSVRKAAAKPGATCLVIGAGAVGLLCAAVAKFSGYGRVVMADIATNRLAFALQNGFADETLALLPRRPSSVEEGLSFAKEDAAAMMARNQGQKFARTFECTGVEGCVRTGIYVSRRDGRRFDHKPSSESFRLIPNSRPHEAAVKFFLSGWERPSKHSQYRLQHCVR